MIKESDIISFYWKQRYSIEYYYGFLVIAINYDNLDNNLNNDIYNNN